MKKSKVIQKTFIITMSFFVFLFGILWTNKSFSSVSTVKQENLPAWKQEINELDSKIKNLEEMKRGYISSAIKHENQAQRLQFINGQQQYAKRHWQQADENRRIAERIQKEIDDLKIQRQVIIKKHQ
ncbi:MAG: hypothetical protein JXA94_05400 [Parachlamydiales bacterium]|nr:hypothetical protein [Parachlamydiales bacterium]